MTTVRQGEIRSYVERNVVIPRKLRSVTRYVPKNGCIETE